MGSLLHTKRNFSFLLVFFLSLGAFLIQGCVPVYTGVPVIDAVNIAGGAIMVMSFTSEPDHSVCDERVLLTDVRFFVREFR